MCRTKQKIDRRIKHNHPESEASSAEEDEWSPHRIHLITIMVHSIKQNTKDGQPFFTTTALVNNRPIKFIIDSGSPVTLVPKHIFNHTTPIHPLHTEYKDVNNNKKEFEGKTTAKVEINGETKNLELLITTERTNLLLGLDWMNQLGIKLDTEKSNMKIQNIQKKSDQNRAEKKVY